MKAAGISRYGSAGNSRTGVSTSRFKGRIPCLQIARRPRSSQVLRQSHVLKLGTHGLSWRGACWRGTLLRAARTQPSRTPSAYASVECRVLAANGPLVCLGWGILPALRCNRDDAGEGRSDDATHCLGITALARRLCHFDLDGSPSVSSAVRRLLARGTTSPYVPFDCSVDARIQSASVRSGDRNFRAHRWSFATRKETRTQKRHQIAVIDGARKTKCFPCSEVRNGPDVDVRIWA
jgi:hypothetical protein